MTDREVNQPLPEREVHIDFFGRVWVDGERLFFEPGERAAIDRAAAGDDHLYRLKLWWLRNGRIASSVAYAILIVAVAWLVWR